jgi:hypothetical protein
MRRTIVCLIAALAIAVGAGPALAQGTFTPMGTADTYVTGMSADGTVVVGVWGCEGPAWRWTQATGVVDIGFILTAEHPPRLPGVSQSPPTALAPVRRDGCGPAPSFATWPVPLRISPRMPPASAQAAAAQIGRPPSALQPL